MSFLQLQPTFILQWSICSPEELKCVRNISVADKECLNKCDGLFITGVNEKEFDQEQVDSILAQVEDEYEKYKTGANLQLPPSIGSKILCIYPCCITNVVKYLRMEEPQTDLNLF